MGFSSTSYGNEGEYGFGNEADSDPVDDPTTFYDPNNPYGQSGMEGGIPADAHGYASYEDQTVALAPGGNPQQAYQPQAYEATQALYGADVYGHQQHETAYYAGDQFAQQTPSTSGPLSRPQTYDNQHFQPSGYHYEPDPLTFGDRLENLLGTSNRRLSAGIVVGGLIAVVGLFFMLGDDGNSSDIRADGGNPNGLTNPSIGDITVPTASVAVLAENNDDQNANANAAATSQTTTPPIEETTTVSETSTSLETTSLLETTSSLLDTSSSLDSTVPPTTSSSLPTSSSSLTTSTLPTSSTVPNPTSATLTPGVTATAGNDIPVGTYSGVVPQGPGCQYAYSPSGGRTRQRLAAPGETITFSLRIGGRVTIQVGCPTNFSVS